MRTFRYVALAAIAAALLATSALAAPKTTKFPIVGKYAGTATTKVDGNTVSIAANGTGTATKLGSGKLTANGLGDSSQQPCVPFAGTGTLTGTGTVLTYKVPTGASGCGDEGGHTFSIKGVFKVVKATGKLAKAKGSLRFSGVYDRDGGTWNVKVTGTLTK